MLIIYVYNLVNSKRKAALLFHPNLVQTTQGGLVFVCGHRDGLMTVSGRKHNTDDVIATVLAVEPMKFIYRLCRVRLYSKFRVLHPGSSYIAGAASPSSRSGC